MTIDIDKWPALIPLAVVNGLGPMLHWSLKHAEFDISEDSLWVPLISAAQEAEINYALLNQTQAQIDRVLNEAGIPATWLKGIALAHTVYLRPWLRPMVDLDVLVPYESRQTALSVVEAQGFRYKRDPGILSVDVPEDVLHHYYLMGSVADAVCLELHFRLLGHDGLELLPREQLNWFWESTTTCEVNGNEITILQPEAHLLYLCAHALLQHGEANLKLLQLFDIHLLITEKKLDWHVISDKAIELKWAYAVERALTITQKYFNTPIPSVVINELQYRRSPNEEISRVTNFEGQGFRSEAAILLLKQLPPAQRPRAMISILFPPPTYIRHRYAVQSGQAVLPYYFYRWIDEIKQVSWSVRRRLAKRDK